MHNVLMPTSAADGAGANLTRAMAWDAATLTATLQLGAIDAAKGASFRLAWAASPLAELLCGRGRSGWPRLHQRAMDIKRAIDFEVRPSPAAPELRSARLPRM